MEPTTYGGLGVMSASYWEGLGFTTGHEDRLS
jgi:hypothetical protein